ncbi:MAG: hypothetical protein ACREYE_13515 [Gammaproteobacteria bacterium]
MGGDIGWGSSHLESMAWPRRGAGRCMDGQAEMGEGLGNHGEMFDGSDDLQGAAAVGTVFDVDIEHPFDRVICPGMDGTPTPRYVL